MRKPARWMTKADERILEFLSEHGNHQPAQIAFRMKDIGVDLDFHKKYIGKRCRKMENYRLLQNVGNGVYSITDLGEQFLKGDIDAGALKEDD